MAGSSEEVVLDGDPLTFSQVEKVARDKVAVRLGDGARKRLATSRAALEQAIAPHVVAREVNAQEELDRSWSEIQRWLRALLRDGADDLVAEELLVFPGLEELMALREDLRRITG